MRSVRNPREDGVLVFKSLNVTGGRIRGSEIDIRLSSAGVRMSSAASGCLHIGLSPSAVAGFGSALPRLVLHTCVVAGARYC